MENKKPAIFIVLKVLGFILLPVAIFGFVLSATNFGNFNNDYFMIGAVIGCIGFFLAFSFLMIGFMPDIQKVSIKTARYVQGETKDDLKTIADTGANIIGDAATTVAKTVKKGLKDTKFCKHCGKEIDADSNFCNKCGKEQ